MTSRQSHYKADDSPTLVNYDKDNDTLRIKPRALNIIWGGDPRYWRISQGAGSAELLQVSWLEVTGQVDLSKFLKKGKEYKLKFVVELRPDNFGWGDFPVYLMVRVGLDRRIWKKDFLKSKCSGEIFEVPAEQHLTFRVPDRVRDEKLSFGLYEIWKGRWKGGLVIHEVIIAPAAHHA
ncbi:Protein PHLOEM PROTEIN 2-LIKE A9 [Platanthera guangdongensis]|uniref:Protein PHLOEM PROTEIN 2-LIKE A9 n=1 Tax=Platanthera guangdongensis TaxID=2320717 RepID=A0ABR2N5C5_9ASPA